MNVWSILVGTCSKCKAEEESRDGGIREVVRKKHVAMVWSGDLERGRMLGKEENEEKSGGVLTSRRTVQDLAVMT